VSLPTVEPRLDLNGHTEARSGHAAPAPTPVATAGPLLLTAAAAAYLAMAEITNATFGRRVLPIHPLS
jgi:succinate-acetate transporter protein